VRGTLCDVEYLKLLNNRAEIVARLIQAANIGRYSLRPRAKGICGEQHGDGHRACRLEIVSNRGIESKPSYFVLPIGRPVGNLFHIDLLDQRSLVTDIDMWPEWDRNMGGDLTVLVGF
jgi:hypothetical protein